MTQDEVISKLIEDNILLTAKVKTCYTFLLTIAMQAGWKAEQFENKFAEVLQTEIQKTAKESLFADCR